MIGHVAPLSGPDKAAGARARNGILLAVEEANEDANRIAGRRLAVHHADSHGDRADIRAVAVRLARVNRAAAVLFGPDAAPLADLGSVGREYDIPLLLPEGAPDRVPGDWVFYTGVLPAERGKALARFAAGKPLKAARVLVLSAGAPDRDAAGAAVADGFLKEFRKQGGSVLRQETYKDAAGLKAAVKQQGTSRPDAVLLAGSAADLAALREADLDARVPVLFAGPEASLQSETTGQPAFTVYAATAFAVDAGTRRSRDFSRQYKERFGEDPDVQAVLANDEARLLFAAMRQASSFEGGKVRDALAGLADFDSLTGPVSFKEHWASRGVFVVRLKNGRTETVARYPPAGGG